MFVHADINDKSQTITIRGRGGLLIKKTAEDDFVEGISFLVTGKDYSKKFKTDKNGEIRVDNLVPDRGSRPVRYASRQALMEAIHEAFPHLRPRKSEPAAQPVEKPAKAVPAL